MNLPRMIQVVRGDASYHPGKRAGLARSLRVPPRFRKRGHRGPEALVFSVEQGWEPLCKFLGVDVPNVPFPHANEGEGMLEKLKMGFWEST